MPPRAARRPSSSGTAALLELARVFAARETRRAIVLVSTSGGSGGGAGARQFASAAHGPLDAAIVLGDVAGTSVRRPFVVPYSNAYGSAPIQLQRTLADAVRHEAGANPGGTSVVGQLAHLTFPFAVGEQGALDATGVPAVLMQVSGERGPSAHDAVSPERLEGSGRAVLSTVDALDAAPDVSSTMETGVPLQRKTLPAWALRLVLAALLFAPLLVAVDGLARMRRRRAPVGRWMLWTLTCALPFLACAVFAYLLGALGILGAAPPAPVMPSALPVDGAARGGARVGGARSRARVDAVASTRRPPRLGLAPGPRGRGPVRAARAAPGCRSSCGRSIRSRLCL